MSQICEGIGEKGYLESDHSLVDHDLLGHEVGADGGSVLLGEASVDVLVHEGGFADPEKWLEMKESTRNRRE